MKSIADLHNLSSSCPSVNMQQYYQTTDFPNDITSDFTTHDKIRWLNKRTVLSWLFCGFNHTVAIYFSMAPRDKSLIKSKGQGFTSLWFQLISDQIIYIYT